MRVCPITRSLVIIPTEFRGRTCHVKSVVYPGMVRVRYVAAAPHLGQVLRRTEPPARTEMPVHPALNLVVADEETLVCHEEPRIDIQADLLQSPLRHVDVARHLPGAQLRVHERLRLQK